MVYTVHHARCGGVLNGARDGRLMHYHYRVGEK
jgi:hypothetical protein